MGIDRGAFAGVEAGTGASAGCAAGGGMATLLIGGQSRWRDSSGNRPESR